MKRRYMIKLQSCDGMTLVEMSLTDQEAMLILRVADEVSNEAGFDSCKPDLHIELMPGEPGEAVHL